MERDDDKRTGADHRSTVPPAPRRGGDLHPWLVRVLVVIVIAVSVAVAAMPVPKRLPAVALESAALYRLEVGAATMLLSTLILALLGRGLVLGRFPTTIGRDGVGWELNSVDRRDADEQHGWLAGMPDEQRARGPAPDVEERDSHMLLPSRTC